MSNRIPCSLPSFALPAAILTAALVSASLAAPVALEAQEARAELSDPEVAHVAVTANTIDAELADFAVPRATSPDVRQFAEMMIRDHTSVNERAGELAERLGVTPEDNEISRSLQEGASDARSELEGLEGREFDRAYMEREAAYHEAVLEALDELLIPSASNEELRRLLEDVRPVIASHLEVARELRADLR